MTLFVAVMFTMVAVFYWYLALSNAMTFEAVIATIWTISASLWWMMALGLV